MTDPAQLDRIEARAWLSVGEAAERLGLQPKSLLSKMLQEKWGPPLRSRLGRILINDRVLTDWLELSKRGLPDLEWPNTEGVYAIEGWPTNYIKIGRARNIARRLTGIDSCYPVHTVKLRAILSDRAGDEAFFHEMWAHLRVKGEWFHLTPELACWLDAGGGNDRVYWI